MVFSDESHFLHRVDGLEHVPGEDMRLDALWEEIKPAEAFLWETLGPGSHMDVTLTHVP